MPGFGKADKKPDFDYNVEGYANHLDAFLKARNVETADLVLHDFGGPWGLAWAVGNVERVKSITLFNIGIMRGYRWHYAARIWRTPLLGEFSMLTTTRWGFQKLMEVGNPRGLPQAFVDRMYGDFDSGTKRAVLRLYRATDNIDEMASAAQELFPPKDIPNLVVWGKADPYVPWKFAAQQRDYFPSAEIHYLDDSGHWPFVDNEPACSALFLPFLERVTATDP